MCHTGSARIDFFELNWAMAMQEIAKILFMSTLIIFNPHFLGPHLPINLFALQKSYETINLNIIEVPEYANACPFHRTQIS